MLKKEGIEIGYIYKIINKINDKMYIGMTSRTVEERWNEHLKSYNNTNSRMYNFKIYKAMREFGIENFYYEVIEECDNSKLSEREKYWIAYYDTTFCGYNTALGGAGKTLISKYKEKAMHDLYINGWMLEEIERAINVNKSDIGEILRNKYLIDTKKNSIKSFGKLVLAVNKYDENDTYTFDSISNAARFLVNNQKTRTKKIECVISKISNVINKESRTAYGYKWIA